ncbi:MAG: hypothetical protein U0P45_08260 [Acidimicrobiales bacterium]
MSAPTPGRKALDPDALAAAEEQRDFLLRSLADLEREHDAGDLTDEDYAELKDDYTARAAAAIRAVERHEAAFADAKRDRNPVRTAAILVGIGLFALLSGAMVAKAMGARKAGESASGGVTMKLTPSQKANECTSQMGTDPTGAFECFTKVLDEDPENPVALTWSAWQLSLAAQSATGTDQKLPRRGRGAAGGGGQGGPQLQLRPGVPGGGRLSQRPLRRRQAVPRRVRGPEPVGRRGAHHRADGPRSQDRRGHRRGWHHHDGAVHHRTGRHAHQHRQRS